MQGITASFASRNARPRYFPFKPSRYQPEPSRYPHFVFLYNTQKFFTATLATVTFWNLYQEPFNIPYIH